jgi:hypothetical protein
MKMFSHRHLGLGCKIDLSIAGVFGWGGEGEWGVFTVCFVLNLEEEDSGGVLAALSACSRQACLWENSWGTRLRARYAVSPAESS